VTDEVLLGSVDLARAALVGIAPEGTVGELVGSHPEEEHVLSLFFASMLPGYPDWRWTVTLARVDEESEPTVLEVELLPGAGALLAPEWVPWATRLAEYHAQQAVLAAAAAESDDVDSAGEDDDEDSDEDSADFDEFDDADAADFDEDGSSILHAGDVDGVDIDELDEDADDSDEDDSDEDDSDDDDSDADDSDDDDLGDDDDSDDDAR
jgi:hypothetical protein